MLDADAVDLCEHADLEAAEGGSGLGRLTGRGGGAGRAHERSQSREDDRGGATSPKHTMVIGKIGADLK
jgi:hypothetical protein